MTKFLQDLHIRNEEPFSSASENVLRDVLGDMGEGDTLIQLGDLFHTSKPYPEEYRRILEIFQEAISRGVWIILLTGNHDFHYDRNSYATAPLQVFGDDIEIISEPTLKEVEGKQILFLPWMPHTLVRRKYKVKTLKEYYEEVFPETLDYEHVDYVAYHFEDETVFMGGVNSGINLSYLERKYPNIKRVGGHIHLQSKNYLGTPFQTRYDEKGQIGRVGVVRDGVFEYETLKQYVAYVDIDYEDELEETDYPVILTIKNAPSIKRAYEKFKNANTFIRKVELTVGSERELGEENLGEASLREMMNSFIKKNNVDKQTSSYLLELL